MHRFFGTNKMASNIIRFTQNSGSDPRIVDGYLDGSLPVMGLPHLEHVVAASYEHGVTVSERISGKVMGKLSHEDVANITDEQLGTLIDTAISAAQAGVRIDPKPSNFLYDPNEGFGIIDLLPAEDHSSEAEAVAMAVSGLAGVGTYGSRPESAEDYSNALQYDKMALELTDRFRELSRGRLTPEDFTEVEESINDLTLKIWMEIQDYTNPVWVEKAVKQHQADRARWTATQNDIARRRAAGEDLQTYFTLDVV